MADDDVTSRIDPGRLRIVGAFTIVIYPSDEEGEDGTWIARLIGSDGFDLMTHASDPVDAAFMAHDLLLCVSDRCGYPAQEHDYSVESTFDPFGYEDEPPPGPAWKCSRCGAKTARDP